MINLRNSPFLWFALLLLLAYRLAALTGAKTGFAYHIPWDAICFICAFLGMRKYNPGHQFKSTIAIVSLILAAGMIRVTEFESTLFPNPPLSSSLRMEGKLEVMQVLKIKEDAVSLRCRPFYLHTIDTGIIRRFTDKFILVQVKEIKATPIFPGDVLHSNGWVSILKPPLNPNAFDIRKYYSTLGIRHQLFCKGNEISIQPPMHNSIVRITAKWQSMLSNIVRQHTTPEVAQLTNALVWGDRSDMNDEVRDAFANSGAMHVLSVSGMHVAIIYSMLFFILGAPGSGSFPRRLTRLGFYIVAILLYVGLTGACPAVVRAGLMIILYLVGKAMGWNTQIWNLLGFAAFLMLWINPFVYGNIGFQLSFLAMAGILLYAKPMIRSLSFKFLLFHRIWEITAVSIAAQVFILPILLEQFHQFPLTFITSSLVAMPASYVVIFGAILNVILSFMGIEWLWLWFDKAGYYFIMSMKWMAGLNPEMNFSLPALGSTLLLGMAIMYSMALIYQWSIGKKIAYALGLSAFLTLGCHRATQWNSDEFIIYHQSKGLLADVVISGYCYTIQDSNLADQRIEFTTRGYRCQRDIIATTSLHQKDEYLSDLWRYSSFVLHLPGASILIWNGSIVEPCYQLPLTHMLVDYCPDMDILLEFINAQPDVLVIFPAHLDRYSKNKMENILEANHREYYDIDRQGYFKLTL